jgi:hypothetical protein
MLSLLGPVQTRSTNYAAEANKIARSATINWAFGRSM